MTHVKRLPGQSVISNAFLNKAPLCTEREDIHYLPILKGQTHMEG